MRQGNYCIGDLIIENPKSKLKVKEASNEGPYPFFTSGNKIKYFDRVICDGQNIFIATGGKANFKFFNGEASYSTDCWSVTTKPKILVKYLYWFLHMLKPQVSKHLFRGAGLKHLDKNRFKKIKINLPNLDEQAHIVEILDNIQSLKLDRQCSIDILEELKQSIFFDMFVAEERAEWPLKTISEISVNMRTGPFGSDLLHSEFVSEGIPVLGIDNAVQNKFAWSKYRFITLQKYEKLKRYTVKPKDLLITIMGTVGRCAVVPDDIPISINTKHLCCISLDRDYVLPEFLHSAFLGHPEILRQLGMQTKGAVMPGLNMGIIKGLKVRLPPIDLQKKYAHKLNQLSLLELDMINSDQKLEELFSSIQYQAFSGELVGDS